MKRAHTLLVALILFSFDPSVATAVTNSRCGEKLSLVKAALPDGEFHAGENKKNNRKGRQLSGHGRKAMEAKVRLLDLLDELNESTGFDLRHATMIRELRRTASSDDWKAAGAPVIDALTRHCSE